MSLTSRRRAWDQEAKAKRAAARRYDAHLGPLLTAVVDDAARWGIEHLADCRKNAKADGVDLRVLASIDGDAEKALDAIHAGRLRGSRARRRLDALSTRYRKAAERMLATCPTCGARVHRARLSGAGERRR
jgi:hypothetical protein